MSLRRILALWQRLVRELRRDRPSMALLFVAPVVLTGLLAFVLREQQAPSVMAVIANQAGAAATPIVSGLEQGLREEGAVVREATDAAAVEAAVRDGSASIGIVLPADFAQALGGGSSPTISIVTRGLEPTADAAQVTVIQKALATAVTRIPGLGARIPRLDLRPLYGAPNADLVDNLAPIYIGFFAYFFVYILTGVSFLRERVGGTLERLLATPVERGEIVVGYSLGFGFFATIQVAVLMVWSLMDLHVSAMGPLPAFSVGLAIPVAGNPLLAYLVVLLVALGAVSLGILLSTFARTELQVIQFIPIVIVPQALLAGILFPVSTLPGILQPISAIMPLTYAVDGLRQVVIRGADLAEPALQADLLVLAAFVAVFAVLAGLTIRREVV